MQMKKKLSLVMVITFAIAFILAATASYYTIILYNNEVTEELLESESEAISRFIGSFGSKLGQSAIDEWVSKLEKDESSAFSNTFLFDNNYRSYQVWHKGTLVAKTSVGPEVDPPKYENDDYYLKHDSEGKLWMVFDRKVGNRDLWVSIAIERVGLKRVPLIFLIFSMFPFILAIGVTCLVSYFLTNQTISLPVSNLARLLRKNDNFDPIHYDKNWPVELAPVIESVNEVLYKAAAIKGRLDSSLQNEKSFTANASHELLTPLAAIKSEVQLLAASDNEQSRSESISEILERVDRATHTIDQLIILSRLDPEERKKQFTQVNVVNTIQNSILLFAGEIEKKSLQVRFPETSELTVEGSGPFLEVLFRNIMSNCVKYSIEGTEIIISFNNVGDGVEVKFLNSSEPLPQYVQDFAFERFVRGPREKEIGVGLGMSIVKRIVEIHSGKITFKQKDDRKTVETSIIF